MGGREPVVSDQEIIDVIRDADDPFLKTSEIAAQLPIKQKGTSARLKDLSEEGRIERKKVGRGYIWWIEEEEDED